MRRMHEEEEAEKENGERWLLTYSDLITLLLALFIIMYTMSSIDLAKLKQLSQNLNQAFNGPAVSSGTGTGTGTGNGNESGNPEPSENVQIAAPPDPLDSVYKELKNYIKTNDLQKKIDISKTDKYVKVCLKDVLLFEPDSPRMLEKSEPVLSEIGKALNAVYDDIDHITISGHTANPSNTDGRSSAIAWELSTERAVTVLNFLAAGGLHEEKLSIEGYSHFNPLASNKTVEGRAKNRRVEITIHKASPPDEDKPSGGTTSSQATAAPSAETDADKTNAPKEETTKSGEIETVNVN